MKRVTCGIAMAAAWLGFVNSARAITYVDVTVPYYPSTSIRADCLEVAHRDGRILLHGGDITAGDYDIHTASRKYYWYWDGSWTQISSPPGSSVYLSTVAMDGNGVMYAGTSTGVYKRTSKYTSWEKVGTLGSGCKLSAGGSGSVFAASCESGSRVHYWNGSTWVSTNKTGEIGQDALGNAWLADEEADDRYTPGNGLPIYRYSGMMRTWNGPVGGYAYRYFDIMGGGYVVGTDDKTIFRYENSTWQPVFTFYGRYISHLSDDGQYFCGRISPTYPPNFANQVTGLYTKQEIR